MIEVKYLGRLGNNLFQYCFGRILAENLGFKLKADPISGFPNTNTKIDGYDYSTYPTQTLNGQVVDLKSILQNKTKRKIVVEGFFQRYEYYKPYKDIIRNDWLFTDKQTTEQVNKNDIIAHIRRRDNGQEVNLFFLPFSFYENVLQEANYDRLFICTNDLSDPFISQFKKFNPIFRQVSPLEDFQFIMSFNKIIQSQSTFSWWTSFLSNAQEIYTPIPLEGYWSTEVQDINLRVDDEDRYIYIKCKEKYKPTFPEKIRILKGKIRSELRNLIK